MTPLRAKMLRYMKRRNYSPSTIKSYISWVEKFANYYNKSPEYLSEEDIGFYLDYLKTERQLSQSSISACYSGIKLLWEKVLERSWNTNKLPRSKRAKSLPQVLSREEVRQIIEHTRNRKHRLILRLLYTTGIRVGEVVKLKLGDIDSKRMVIRIKHGKGNKDRYVVLSGSLLEELRVYWKWYRPEEYLFEGAQRSHPISIRTVQHVFKQACRRIGLRKQVGVHVLRHSFATHLLESGVDTLLVKTLLGHANLSTTSRYLHVANNQLQEVPDLSAAWKDE